MGLVFQTTCFFVVSRIFVCKMQLLLLNCRLERPILVIVEFLEHFLQGGSSKAQKLYRKLPKVVKDPKNSPFFQYLGHFEEPLDHNIGIFFEKTCFEPSSMLWSFEKLLVRQKFPISKKLTKNDANFSKNVQKLHQKRQKQFTVTLRHFCFTN